MNKKDECLFDFAASAIRLISCVLNNKAVPAFSDNFDWSGFADFCSAHKIINIIAYGLKNSDFNIPNNISEKFNDSLLHSMMKEAQRDVEIEQLSDEFEKNNINHMTMKGYVIKNIYPHPFLRTMGDVDILVGDYLSAASEEMKKLGYKLKGEAFLHDIYSKGKHLVVELHKSLIDESLDKYYDYFGVGFEKAKLCDGFKFRYELTAEDFYIFMVAHTAKHYEICGTGIRSVCDIFVFLNHYGETLDMGYIESELDKIELRGFENKIRNLSYEWFSGDFDGEFDAVGKYLVSDGVYGNIDNHELNAYLLDNKKESKFLYYLHCIFPGREYMGARYPKSLKYPFLLPFYWVKRIISTMFKSRGSIRYRLKGVADSDKNDGDRFTEAGIKKL